MFICWLFSQDISKLNWNWTPVIYPSHFKTFNKNDSSNKETNKKLVDHLSSLRPDATLYRTRSLIKPPPPRSSWELLLDEYLKDPNDRSLGPLNLSPSTEPAAFHLFSELTSPDPTQAPFIPSPYPPQSSSTQQRSYPTSSSLPARRCQMTLDELVYLVSQVGRADLYREMVQYLQVQRTVSTSSPVPPSPSPARHMNQSVSHNAHLIRSSSSSRERTDRESHYSSQVQEKLIKKLHRLTIKAKMR